jgi:hypothetical protein
MDRHRRAFALMIAMIAVAAVFAAAMSLSLLTRASVVESGALSRALEQELAARTAASRAVAGIVGEGVTASGEAAPDAPSAGDAPEVETDEMPEMPEFLREFLEGMIDEETPEEGDPEPAPVTPTSTRNAQRYLAARGLPDAPVVVEVSGAAFEVRLLDAASRINLNRATLEELEALARAAGAEPLTAASVAAEIIDYRDEDDFVTPRGAEREDYSRRNLQIRNAALLSVDELGYLPSMTPTLLRNLRPLVTVLGDGKLHAPSVPETILRALPGMTSDSASRIISLRNAGRLDADSLEKALPGFAPELVERFRFRPSPLLRVIVRRADAPGPTFEGLAAISPSAGVQWASFGVR